MITVERVSAFDEAYEHVTKDQLYKETLYHINNVAQGLGFIKSKLDDAAKMHDVDKLTDIDTFYSDYKSGFNETNWWDVHRKISRHHINEDSDSFETVNLVDVLEMIVDCVMAGAARSGSVFPVTISDEILQRAVKNTTNLLISQLNIVDNRFNS